MSTSKLSDELRDVIVGKVSSGWSLQRCVEWLDRTHNIDINKSSLSRMLKGHRADLADVTKGVARQAIAPTVESGMQALKARLDKSIAIVEKAEIEAEADPIAGIDAYAKAINAYAKVHDLWQRAAGIEQPDDPVVDGLAGILAIEIDRREDEAKAELAEVMAHDADADRDSADPADQS